MFAKDREKCQYNHSCSWKQNCRTCSILFFFIKHIYFDKHVNKEKKTTWK
jgi:hypothetical protein